MFLHLETDCMFMPDRMQAVHLYNPVNFLKGQNNVLAVLFF